MECTQKKQLVAYPKVRIQKNWLRYFFGDKTYKNEGTTHLFSLVALYSYANFRSNYHTVEGDQYLEGPGEWICRVGSLPRILRVHSKQQAIETMDYLQENGFLRYQYLPTEKDWIRFEICDWDKYCVHLEYNYYSYKARGFFFFPLPVGRKLMKVSGKKGKRIFSQLDAIVDMWLHTIFNDKKVQGSDLLPVLYYPDMKGKPLISYAYLAKRWGWSKSRVGRFILKLEEDGLISHFSFAGTHGTVISVAKYREMIHGTDEHQVMLQEVGEVLGLVALLADEKSTENLLIHAEKSVPLRSGKGKVRYRLRIEGLNGLIGVYSTTQNSFIYKERGSKESTIGVGTNGDRGVPDAAEKGFKEDTGNESNEYARSGQDQER